MDTKELLDRLRCPGIDACPLQDTRTTCTECQKTVKKEAAEVIEKLSNGAGWISVEERLPKDDSYVLAYLRIGEEGRIYAASYAKGVWWDCIFNTPATKTTTHWMPLPEPPEEDV